jgi:hypothetical protein
LSTALPSGPLCSHRFIAASLISVSAVSFNKLPPLSARLLREVHARLLRSGRGAHRAPGEFRRTQNWLGGSRPGLATGRRRGKLYVYDKYLAILGEGTEREE